jgi:hypothetical protein
MKRLSVFLAMVAALVICLSSSFALASKGDKAIITDILGKPHVLVYGSGGLKSSMEIQEGDVERYSPAARKFFRKGDAVAEKPVAKSGAVAFRPIMIDKKAEIAVANKIVATTPDLLKKDLQDTHSLKAQTVAPKVQSASVPPISADQNIKMSTSSSCPVAPMIGAKKGQPASKIAAIAPRSGSTPAITPKKTQKPLAVTTPEVRPGSGYNPVVPNIAKTPASAPPKSAGQNMRAAKSGARAQTLAEYAAFRPTTRLVASTEKDFPVDGGTLTVSRKKYIIYDRDLDGNPVMREREVTRKEWVNRPKGGEAKKYFAWLPGQILPPDWTQRVGNEMDGIDPATGNIMKFPIPNGAVTYCNNRGDAAGVIGKYIEVPEGAQLLAENMPREKEKS